MNKWQANNPQQYPLTPEEIGVLRQSKIWQHIEEWIRTKSKAEQERLSNPVSSEDLHLHNVRVGRLQAFKEILSYPDKLQL